MSPRRQVESTLLQKPNTHHNNKQQNAQTTTHTPIQWRSQPKLLEEVLLLGAKSPIKQKTTVNQRTTREVKKSAKEHRGTPAAPTTTVRQQPKAVNGQAPKATSKETKPQARKEHRGATNV